MIIRSILTNRVAFAVAAVTSIAPKPVLAHYPNLGAPLTMRGHFTKV